jgi:hypothetical protein
MGRRGTELAGDYTFFYRKGNENHELGTGFLLLLFLFGFFCWKYENCMSS